jgi:hypothetical protein
MGCLTPLGTPSADWNSEAPTIGRAVDFRRRIHAFTVTSTGELTAARGLDGNGWPGSTPGRVGPRPVANRDKISPADVGLYAETTVKSLECVTAGPLLVATI